MINDYRKSIDFVDRKILELLKERFEICEKIGEYKQINLIDVCDVNRENEKIESLKKALENQDAKDEILEIFAKIIEESKAYQEKHKYRYGLLGKNLSHTYSPKIHKMLGGYDFGVFDIEQERLEEFLKKGEFDGLCVTMPYKIEVMKYLSEISDTAKLCQSVNVIVKNEDGSLKGYNTDYFGLRYQVVSSGIEIRDKKCLILGNGGVSKTVKAVLSDLDAGEIITISRKGEDNYKNIKKHYDADIIINATPVGMYPQNGISLIDIDKFPKLRGVLDLIYNPLRTKLVLDAQKKGIKASGGLEMLVAQAALGCEIFTGKNIIAEEIDKESEALEKSIENIVLIGMPGCGKTSIGKILSKITGKPFIDIDKLIEDVEDRLCEQIIITDGIEMFRKIEEKAVRKVCSKGNFIVALGGGAVETASLEDCIRENGKVVYIRRNLNDLPVKGRPISKEKGVEAIFEERKDKYISWSDLQVDNEGIEDTAVVIAALLGYYKKGEIVK